MGRSCQRNGCTQPFASSTSTDVERGRTPSLTHTLSVISSFTRRVIPRVWTPHSIIFCSTTLPYTRFALMQLLSTVLCLWAAVSQCAVLRRFNLMSVCCTLDLTDQQRLSRERQIIRPQASTLLSLMRTCSREQSAMATGSTTSLARDWHHSTPARAHTRSFAMSKTTERKVSYLPRYPNVYLLL